MFRRRALATAVALLAAGTAPALATEDTLVRVQPGDPVTIDGSVCALGFLLSGSDGASYMTTAGHCVFPDGGTRAWTAAEGPVVMGADGRIGRVVFAENVPSADGDDEYDFTVLRLDDDVDAVSEISGVGVPSGINEEQTRLPTRLRTAGSSSKAGGPQRELLARTMERPEFVYAYGAPVPGTVGGPVVDARGRAVGTLLGADDGTYDFGPDPEHASREGAPNRIGRLAPVLLHATYATRLGYRLVVSRPG